MIIGNSTAQYKAMNRMQACTYTIRTLLTELEDPGSIELRADLAIQAQDLLNEVVLLSDRISNITWQELDKKAHPSNN